MDIGRPDTTTEAQELICMVHNYKEMCPMWSYILAPLTEVDSVPNGRKLLWSNALEMSLIELNCMVSAETLLSYTDWKLS